MPKELKPCPACGASVCLEGGDEWHNRCHFVIRCENPECGCVRVGDTKRGECIRRWNALPREPHIASCAYCNSHFTSEEEVIAHSARCPKHPANIRAKRLEEALETLLRFAECQICYHESTHRGGSIWTICDDCGAKWADDEGGKPKFKEPKEIVNARKALAAARKALEAKHVHQ